MPRTKLRVSLPPESWMETISTRYDDAEFRALSALPRDGTGVVLLKIVSPEFPAIIAEVTAADATDSLELLQVYDDGALVEFETSAPAVLSPVRESGVPIEMPMIIRDGVATIEVTASRDRLSSLATQLRESGMHFDVDYVRDAVDDESVLTDYQSELVATAVREGYYDTPRRCTLTELAEKMDIAKSTASETLHRAEENIIKQFTDDNRTLQAAT